MVAMWFSPLWWAYFLYVNSNAHPPLIVWTTIAVVNWAIYGFLASIISGHLRKKSVPNMRNLEKR
jgi:uncharacterized protein with PQ loop repeat